MPGFIAKKLGMTRVLTDNGEFVAATVLDVSGNSVSQVKNTEKDKVAAIVIERPVAKRGLSIRKKQFTIAPESVFEKGQDISAALAKEVEFVRISGISKGKGFQGVIKRHNFHGMPGSHGAKYRRAPGSIGTRKPTRTMRGRKLPGHMGSDTITLKKVPVLDLDISKSLLVVRGPVPGSINSIVYITLL